MAAIFDTIISPIRTILGCPKEKESKEEDLDPDYDPPPVVDICDQIAARHMLDDTCASYFTEVLGLCEDHYSSNLKLIIMTFACAVALVGQFFPIEKFWYGRYLVGCCCATYFISSSVLQLVYWYVDDNIIIRCKPDDNNGGKVLQLRTELERYETKYKIILEVMGKNDGNFEKKVEKEVDIGQFFKSDGSFYEAGLDATMKDLVDTHYLKQKNL
jgi:hypothetical protein